MAVNPVIYIMLKRLFSFLPKTKTTITEDIIPRDNHNISRKHIGRSALKVMYDLNEAGYQAYLVGGGVRDLLLGERPKDFDVATDATPEQVKKLFRNSRIIGRRFKIVHVRFGRDIIEVTTFRGHHDDDASSHHSARSEEGMLLRDNVYGDIRSDAIRRDFTINALYYTVDKFSIHDFTGGIEDIKRKKIRMIGKPELRYQEDPVRMLRAARFAAKLGFEVDTASAKPIFTMGQLLQNIPSARLFEEVLKLFMGGYATASFEKLQQFQLLQYLLPATTEALEKNQPYAEALIKQALANTDKRIHNQQRVTPAFIFAAMLWGPLCKQQQALEDKGLAALPAHQQAAQDIIARQIQATSIPKRFTQTMREIWELQSRLDRRQGNRAQRLFEHPRFRAAYDFLLMREQAGENLQGLGAWWTHYQEVDTTERLQMVAQLGSGTRKRKKRRKPQQPAV